ncbi:OsmC family protein [Bdellovibrio bacteriovorus]|uniref:Osmotically inducible protein n=1 Tax=Bdellovibrio bacteriovorus (strain ATCC 15356 / DSM 50701 / NCIMB 9529 / HD100) TaxID=264462 RepID=Q6MN27_BDEBA|nr:OsmC family protein [Bdellovibrio bacteriovorus]AHZ83998.1 peroxiredoxin OsmC [Bdellovibrio bacteriovorus]BEV67881.1 Peroxiredoxin OsmC [Bdellovibrio bacteriovorus]CAE79325.1 osmotically inducible protein [Bdellovibrio bacteriovorus HD100]
MQRKGSAHWQGNLQNGSGELSTESGALKNLPYSFSDRFENGMGTNPEELIGAAHSGCFAMALSGALAKKGFNAESLDVSATVTLEKSGDGFVIQSSKLKLRALVPGIDRKLFETIAQDAKVNCPVSKVLKAEISLEIDFHELRSPSATAH